MTHPIEPLVDYALGTLEAPEIAPLEAHLSSCESCRAEVARLRTTLALLAEELEPVAAPRGAWERVQAQVHRPVQRFVPRWAIPAAAALLLLVLVSSGLWWRNELALRETRENQAIINRWMTLPDVRFVALTNRAGQTVGRVMLRGSQALIVMPAPAPSGQSYQAWGLFEHSRTAPAVSLGVSNRAVFEVTMKPYPWFWLSLERSGGNPTPTKSLGWSQVDGG